MEYTIDRIALEDDVFLIRDDTKQDLLISGENIKTINGESVLGSGDINTNLTEITYSELRLLRDESLLVPGQYYRITDYVTTCAEHGNHYSAVNTYSAGHQFDIIVMALSEDKLDENASAVLHEGDTYFDNCAISQWKIDYTIDNDTEKFRWASPDGKGVIYYMEDEHGNACTYDFKNIQYDVPSMSILGMNWKHDTSLYDTYEMGFEQGKRYYTFSFLNDSGEIEDASMVYISKTTPYATNNVIKRPNDWGYLRDLPVIVILSLPLTHDVMTKYDYNYIGRNITTNKFDETCEFIFMIAPCERTCFKPVSRYNIIGPSSVQNYFGDYTVGNFIEAITGRNTIGSSFRNNILGTRFYNNTISGTFDGNTIGEFFQSNNIGENFGNNTIGDYFYYNNVGSTFYGNRLGNVFNANTFGAYFVSNVLSLDYDRTSLLNNCIGCKFDDNVYTNTFYPKAPYDNTSDCIVNVHVCRGICGTSSSFNYVEIQHKNSESEITITKTSDNNIVEHCVSDWCIANKVKQSINLIAGKNYITFYVNTTLKELYNALGNNGEMIETQSDGGTSQVGLMNIYDNNNGVWSGSITELDFSKMYSIRVVEDTTIEVSGELLNPKDITITLNPGWNWIGYPVNEEIPLIDALADLDANVGDVIKSQSGTALYTEEEGWLSFDLIELEPGEGFMYNNTSSETKTFTFPTELDIALSTKQDKLVSGTNIKTVNGTSILGSGDITIESGSEQIQSDWNETDTTSKSYIANKPNIYVDDIGILEISHSDSIGIDSKNEISIHGGAGVQISGALWLGTSRYVGLIPSSNGDLDILDTNDDTHIRLRGSGDGTKILSDDGKYKTIKTINGESIIGSGNIVIESGSEQIQSDWNETDTTSKSYIANKPLEKITITNGINIPNGEYYKIDNLYLDEVYAGYINMCEGRYINFGNGNCITTNGVNMVTICNEGKYITLIGNGNGTKFLSNDGTYKSISTAYPQVNHGTSDTTFALNPNVLHVWDEVAELYLTLANPTDTTVANEYLFQFTSGATATILTLPDTIKWVETPSIESDKIYQISILNNCGTILGFV